ncbi:DUF3592 domain-containing protein [Flavobacterium sp. LC2016-12]|uniref:DUF3592 domain-containing protein n=1 Tax=Flavobacterium sp. LC2016-12 TaxID=2783794 RepID=UPI00188CA62C|nr:DUF3592 domain-containing protein [Flavobacterium sp. LC2016-12]MBF4466204.1 hypothetical protein [Flavobacterium sp. LC2016-12]
MEILSFLSDSFWDLFLVIMGFLAMVLGIDTYKKEKKLHEIGIKTIAKVVGFSDEETSDGVKVTVPVFEFNDSFNNKIRVKGVSNSICKINETTVVYYDPKNPETEFYFSKKDFLVKYLFFFVGLFFLILGFVYLYNHFIAFNSK